MTPVIKRMSSVTEILFGVVVRALHTEGISHQILEIASAMPTSTINLKVYANINFALAKSNRHTIHQGTTDD
jgi:hypothetical protein